MTKPRSTARTLLLSLALTASGQAQPTPTPEPTPQDLTTATPTPAPAVSASTPFYSATLPDATPLPEMPPVVVPTPDPTYSATMPDAAVPTPTPVPTAVEPDLDPSLANPGPPPAPVPDVQRNPEDVTPSKATIRKLNEEAVEKINAFARSQRNPAVADLTLEQAIDISFKQNPDILNAIEQIRLTRGQIIEVTSQALPHLNAVGGFTQQQTTLTDPKRPGVSSSGNTIQIPNGQGGFTPVDFGNFGGGGSSFVNPQSWNVGFQASQLLYNGGAVVAGIKAARFVEDSAYFSLRQTIDQTIANVKTAFYQVILNRALVVAQQQSVNLLQEQLQDQQSRYEAGTVPRFNVLQAQVALANAQPPLISALNNLRVSQYQLVKTLGMDYKTSKPSEVPFNVVGGLPYQPRAINPDESIRIAIERSPLLKAQRQSILANNENVHVQFAGYLPSVSATADYTWKNNQAFHSLGEVTQGWTYGIQGSWAIFDGGETAGQVAQAKAQLQQAVINYDNSVRQVILNVQQSISNLQTAEQTLTSQEASVVQATEALRLAQERLDAGAGTQLDVLNQQTQLLQSQTTVLQARYDYLAALASYDLALSLDAQYEESFDDPLTRSERAHFSKATNPTAPQPALPGKLRHQDPISGLAVNAPVPYVPPTKAGARDNKSAPEPTPKPKRKKVLGIF
ncbi:MAG TPA: TolC family protein [Chthoniobacterales bacterium]